MQISGFFLVDKPIGVTSHDVVDYLRKITEVKKIGHAGTLDPLASGLLIMAVGRECTKKIDEFKNLDKEYLATIKLGEISTTYDAEGEITISNLNNKQPSAKEVKQTLDSFVGEQVQMPPVFSAKKIKGQQAYKLARKKQKVELKTKDIVIYDIELLDYSYPNLKVRVKVSPGTYIRSLAHDLGQKLGVGAHLVGLIRTKIGDYNLEQAKNLKNIRVLSDLDDVKIEWS